MNFITLDHAIDLLPTLVPQFDKVQLFFTSQLQSTIERSTVYGQYIRESNSKCVMATAIEKESLARLSWTTTNSDDLKISISSALLQKALKNTPQVAHKLNEGITLPKVAAPNTNLNTIHERLEVYLNDYFAALSREWPNLQFLLRVERTIDHHGVVNSNGISGSYSRDLSRLSVFFLTGSMNEPKIFWKRFESVETLLEQLRSRIQAALRPASVVEIRKGSLPILLSPWVVERICLSLSDYAIIGAPWPNSAARALPESFELVDIPNLQDGYHAAPFDDEGTITTRKPLVLGSKRQNTMNDLTTAHKFSAVPSGNGFRRGLFFEKVSDLAPLPRPSDLLLTPGTLLLDDVLKSHSKIMIADDLVSPMNASIKISEREHAIHGRLFERGKYSANLVGQSLSKTSMASAKPHSYGSLLDPSALVLADGELTYSGWFPYVFLRKVTWS